MRYGPQRLFRAAIQLYMQRVVGEGPKIGVQYSKSTQMDRRMRFYIASRLRPVTEHFPPRNCSKAEMELCTGPPKWAATSARVLCYELLVPRCHPSLSQANPQVSQTRLDRPLCLAYGRPVPLLWA